MAWKRAPCGSPWPGPAGATPRILHSGSQDGGSLLGPGSWATRRDPGAIQPELAERWRAVEATKRISRIACPEHAGSRPGPGPGAGRFLTRSMPPRSTWPASCCGRPPPARPERPPGMWTGSDCRRARPRRRAPPLPGRRRCLRHLDRLAGWERGRRAGVGQFDEELRRPPSSGWRTGSS